MEIRKDNKIMSNKIQKSMIVAGVATLSGVLSQTANADQLDDAVNEAKKAGFETSVTTKTVTVSTKAEADKLNQEEAARIQKLASDVRTATEKAVNSDKSVQQLREGIQTSQRAVEGGQGSANDKARESAQIDYEKRVAATKAHNAKLEADYKVEKARVAEENRKLEEDYQFKKTQADLKNQDEQNKYIVALAKAKQQEADYQKSLAEYNKKKQAAEEVHEKRFTDETLDADAARAGVEVEPGTLVDKGTVSESELPKLATEYETVKAEVRNKLAEATAQKSANVQAIKNHQDITAYINEQKRIIQEKLDADNRDLAGANHITTVIREEPVTGNDATIDAIKAAYERIKSNVDDEHVRTYEDAKKYFKSKGLSDDDVLTAAHNNVASMVLSNMTNFNIPSKSKFETEDSNRAKLVKILKNAGTVVNYKDIHKTLPSIPIGVTFADKTNPSIIAYNKAIKELDGEIEAVHRLNYNAGLAVAADYLTGVLNLQYSSPYTLSDNYAADSSEYNRIKHNLQEAGALRGDATSVMTNPEALKTNLNRMIDEMGAQLYGFHARSMLAKNDGYRNKNNMKITRSSDKVQYLQTPDASDGNSAGYLFDTANTRTTSNTPVFNRIADNMNTDATEYSLVRIPKGQSVTVTYSLKDGSAYDQSDLNESGIRLFEKRLVELGGAAKITKDEAKNVTSIEMTITNDGAVGNGDIIVGVRNNINTPFYIGVANGIPGNSHPWSLVESEPSMAFAYHIDTKFKGDVGVLAPAIKQYEATRTPHLYHDIVMGSDIHLQDEAYYKGFDESNRQTAKLALSKESPIEENATDIDKPRAVDFGIYVPASRVPEYKDKHRWEDIVYNASPSGLLTSTVKTYDKRLVDWGARDDRHNWSTLYETGYASAAAGLGAPIIPRVASTVIKPKPIERPREITLPNVTLDWTRELVLPTVNPLPASASEPVGIRPVVWKVKYKGTFDEPEPKKPNGEVVKPKEYPYPDKPVLKTQPEPPVLVDSESTPETPKIAASANSLALKARIANKPKMSLERIRYVAANRFSSGNTLVVRGIDKNRKASSSNSLVVRGFNEVRRVGSGNTLIVHRR